MVQQTRYYSKGCCYTPESDATDSMPHLDQSAMADGAQ
jgi:hypothetical protein